METKVCSKCKQEKPVSEFAKNPKMLCGYSSHCNQCKGEYGKKYRKTANGIYISAKYQRRNKKPFALIRKEFYEWHEKQPKKCHYCWLPESELENINDPQLNRTSRLGLDCIDNKKGYLIDNIVLSCLRCNFIKNDLLDYEAMKDIGQRYVKPIWEKRLGKTFS